MRSIKLAIQSASGKINNGFQRAWLLKQMSGTRHDFNAHRGPHQGGGALVELAYLGVTLTDDQKSRSLHACESLAGQVRPTAP